PDGTIMGLRDRDVYVAKTKLVRDTLEEYKRRYFYTDEQIMASAQALPSSLLQGGGVDPVIGRLQYPLAIRVRDEARFNLLLDGSRAVEIRPEVGGIAGFFVRPQDRTDAHASCILLQRGLPRVRAGDEISLQVTSENEVGLTRTFEGKDSA